jgi:thiol-disulfide isomerase/thioredoxin
MKNVFLLLLTFSFLTTSCEESQKAPASESSISGYIDNIPGAQLTLSIQTPEGIIPIDTTWIAEDGHFLFTTEFNEIAVYRVMVEFNKYLTIAAKKGDHIVLEADGLDLYNNYYVEGSSESELIKIVVDKTMKLGAAVDSIRLDINHHKAAKNSKALYNSFEEQKRLYAGFHSFSVEFINQNPGSIAAYFVVMGLQPEEDPNQFTAVAEGLTKSYPKFNFLPTLQERVGVISLAQVGIEAIELNFPTPEGEMVALSSLRGKYVLVDFWASWCRPCRAENPNVLRLYNKFKDKGFEIYGYSLDKERETWLQAIKDDGINWIHTSDLKGWEAEGSILYGVHEIPATFLIDPNGIIVARDLKGPALEQKLTELLGE